MSGQDPDRCREYIQRIRDLELDLAAERDLRIGNLAELGRAEQQVQLLRNELNQVGLRQALVARLHSFPLALNLARKMRRLGSSQ